MASLHRSRYRALIMPDLRHLRRALSLTVNEAAKVVDEHSSLLQSQEEGGAREDREFTRECARRYLAYAVGRIRHDDLPPMTSPSGTSAVYWLRNGLGLKERDGVDILRQPWEWVEAVEAGSRRLPDSVRVIAWCGYVDWAYRHYQRQDRLAAARPQTVTQKRMPQPGWSLPEASKLQQLAYAPRLSPAKAEAEARRLLGLP